MVHIESRSTEMQSSAKQLLIVKLRQLSNLSIHFGNLEIILLSELLSQSQKKLCQWYWQRVDSVRARFVGTESARIPQRLPVWSDIVIAPKH